MQKSLMVLSLVPALVFVGCEADQRGKKERSSEELGRGIAMAACVKHERADPSLKWNEQNLNSYCRKAAISGKLTADGRLKSGSLRAVQLCEEVFASDHQADVLIEFKDYTRSDQRKACRFAAAKGKLSKDGQIDFSVDELGDIRI